MSIDEFSSKVKLLAGSRQWSARIVTDQNACSDGNTVTVVGYYGWIEGHRIVHDYTPSVVLALLGAAKGAKPGLREV